MVDVKDVAKVYGNFRAVDGVTFSVRRGEVLGFLGPNGAGKTTMMKIITGFMAPTRGDVRVGGRDVLADPLYTKARIGYLPENNPLYKEMLVADYLEYVADMRGIPAESRGRRVADMVKVCGLNTVFGKYVGELSKGFRQRVGLAQAMIHDPDILILDEPTAGLDPNQVIEMRELIRRLGQHKTVILSTHNLSEVEATCDRAIIIASGKVVKDASIAELQAGVQSVAGDADSGPIRRYMVVVEAAKPAAAGAGPDASLTTLAKGAFQKLEGADTVTLDRSEGASVSFKIEGKPGHDLRRDIFEAAVSTDLALLELSVEEERLEDIFHQLTTT